MYANTFDRGIAASDGSFGANFIATTFSPVLRGNTWIDFPQTYTGVEIDGNPSVPIRTWDLQATAGKTTASTAIVISNIGTTPLQWTASTDSPWLALTPSNGTVLDEHSTSSIAVTCNTVGLESGTPDALVTLASGGRIQKISVTLTIGAALESPRQLKVSVTVIAPGSNLAITQ